MPAPELNSNHALPCVASPAVHLSEKRPQAAMPNPKWAYVWIAYTGFLFIQPLMEPSLRLWFGTLISFALFLVIFAFYVRASDDGSPTRFWLIGATFVLGLLTFPWNGGASTFFVYTAAFIPFSIVSVRRVLWLFLLEILLISAEGYRFTVDTPHGFLHIGLPNTLIAIFLTLVIGGGNIFFAQQKRADGKLRLAQEMNVTLAAVAERERIARDLHDVLGHTLSVIVLKAELAGRLLNHPTAADPARAAREIADVERTARTALAEVREAIGGYRAQGLAAEIESARRTLDAAGVTLVTASEPGAPYLDSEMWAASNAHGSAHLSAAEETVLALALREAVTNIVRHAQATSCHLRFITQDGRRRLVVEDNGRHPLAREGNGLRGMRERVESLGGHLSLERDKGTRLLIDLPLRPEAA
jgi:two-component system, NarL family, sensor histidine kinase DesK